VFKKLFNRIKDSLPIILVAALLINMLAVAFLPPMEAYAAGENWLTGWTYRKEITIDGSTAGVQTDYTLPLTIHYGEEGGALGNPTGLTFIEKYEDLPPAFGHGQGGACDGTYIWYSKNNYIGRTSMASPDFDNPLAYNDHVCYDGTYLGSVETLVQINNVSLRGDYIYTTCRTREEPFYCYIKWFDSMTLEFAGEHEILWDHDYGTNQEGVAYYDGYWWVAYYASTPEYVTKYDTAWNYIGDYLLPNYSGQTQGLEWFNGQLWTAVNDGPIYVYDWDGSNFTLCTTFTNPHIEKYQGLGISPGGGYLYIADFTNVDPYPDNLVKLAISWEGGGGGGGNDEVYCSNHCQDDFDDIRFTESDGQTELDYWIEDYTLSDEATFWVEFDSIPASPDSAAFYMYYGKTDASSDSDGEATFPFFDDFPGAAINTTKWDGDTGDTSVAGSVMTLASASGWKAIETISQFGPTTAIRSKMYLTTAVDYYARFGLDDAASTTHMAIASVDDVPTKQLYTKDGTTLTIVDTNWDVGSWMVVDLIVRGGTNVRWFIDGSEGTNSPKTTNPPDANDLEFNFRDTTGDGNIKSDWVLARKYAYPEPAWGSWGGETLEGGAPPLGPTVHTLAPTGVTTTAGTLEGEVLAIGDTSIAYRGFVWDTTSHGDPGNVAINATAYANNWSEPGNWSLMSFDKDLTGLGQGQVYYHRAGARNNDDEWSYGPEVGMVTIPGNPSSFTATTFSTTQIDLAWSEGVACNTTKIMGKVGSYPTGVTDGVEVYSGGNESHSDTGLTPSTAYYYKAWAVTTWGEWSSYSSGFAVATNTTASGFAVTTLPASGIGNTYATLEGTLTDAGGETCSLRFVHGTSDSYGSSTPWEGPYETGASYSKQVTGLLAGNQYHFRAEAKHGDGTTVYGSDEIFSTTGAAPGAPTNFASSSTTTQISLSWNKGTGASDTLIRFSTDTYPATVSDGVALYLGTGTSTSHTEGLVEGVTYYYSAWGKAGTAYSTNRATTYGQLSPSLEPGELSPPEICLIEDVRICESFIESGDALVVGSYKVIYEFSPTQDMEDFFKIQVFDGDTLLCQGVPSRWGYMPFSIYQAPGHSLVWGSSYTVLLIGREGKWDTPPEASYTLGSGSWFGECGDCLGGWATSTASSMGDYTGDDLTQYTPTGTVLNEEGSEIFEDAIPGLRDAIPSIFSGGIVEWDGPPEVGKVTIEIVEGFGVRIMSHLEDLGNFLGLDKEVLGTVFWLGIFLLCSAGAAALGAPAAVGIVISGPVIFVGIQGGMVPIGAILAIGVLIILYVTWHIIPKGV